MQIASTLKYERNGCTFLCVTNILGEIVSLPLYLLLLSKDLISALQILESRYQEDLKLEVVHGIRRFRVWYVTGMAPRRIRIEEFKIDSWEIVHSYHAN